MTGPTLRAGDPTVASLLSRCTFPPPGPAVTLAVSGGPDSLALLALAAAAGLDATAVHVDHGLRPGSAEEATVVAAAAERFGLGFEARTALVSPGPNLEARARSARYAALPPGVLTGHTMDDQAETVLLHLLRGSGLHGLAAIRPGGQRPLLALRRSETAALCRHLGLDPVVDPSNLDPSIRRNRVRLEALPLLADIAERDPVPILARTATLMRATADHLDDEALALDPTDARALAAAPPLLAALAVRAWLTDLDPHGHPPDAAAVARVLAVARGEAVATEVAGGHAVRRSAWRLRVEPAPATGGSGTEGVQGTGETL